MIDPINSFAMLAFLLLAIGLPLLGWACIAFDYRAYLRSFRRVLVVVGAYCDGLPYWVHREKWIENRPPCFVRLELTPPCTREEVLAAYRVKVKLVHPDHGGTREDFDLLQSDLETALAIVDASVASDS